MSARNKMSARKRTKKAARKRTKKPAPKPTPKDPIDEIIESSEEPEPTEDLEYGDFPLITLFWGDDGQGKSLQAMGFEKPIKILDVENRLKPLAMRMGFPLGSIVDVVAYTDTYRRDGKATLTDIRETIGGLMNEGGIRTLVIDGITDIRPYARDEWCEEKDRANPVTAGDWRDINDKVRDICFPLINWGRAKNINIVFTAMVAPKYENLKRVGEEPACKNWIWHNVDQKFRLFTDSKSQKYLAFCEKSWFETLVTLDLTGQVFIHDLLRDHKAWKENIKKYLQWKKRRKG